MSAGDYLLHSDQPMQPLASSGSLNREYDASEGVSSGAPEEFAWFTAGDINAYVALTLNNVATLLSICVVLVLPLGQDIVYGRLVPGVGWATAFGCAYYYWMAWRMRRLTGRNDICAQPYGINTPGAFAFAFSVIMADFFNHDPSASLQDRQEHAWKVGVAANFVASIILLVGSMFGPWITRNVPLLPLLTSLAGIGISYLGIGTLLDEMQYPLVGFVALLIFFLNYFGGVEFRLPGTKVIIPASVLALVVGSAIGWMDGVKDLADVRASGPYVKAYAPVQSFTALFDALGSIGGSFSTIVPVAITVAVGTIQCVLTAHGVGDMYSVRDSMIGDGLGTFIGAALGSPLGMTVYIGQPAYKRMGARSGYLILTGITMWAVCVFGLIAPLNAIIVIASVQPILLSIGLDITKEVAAMSAHRHLPAVIFGLFPSLANWASGFAVSQNPTVTLGLANLGNGNILIAIVWCALIMYMVDRDYARLGVWALAAGVLAFFGMIHAPQVGWLVHKDDVSWKFAIAYLMMAVISAGMRVLQKRDLIEQVRPEALKEEADRVAAAALLEAQESGRRMQPDFCCGCV